MRNAGSVKSPTVSVCAVSHPGKVRPYQEDAFVLGGHAQAAGVKELIVTEATLPCDGSIAAVIDGMGGMGGGDIASSWLARRWAGRHARSIDPLSTNLRKDHFELLLTASTSPTPLMGDVATGVALQPDGVLLFHVGDSRAYLVRANSCTQLTTDHVSPRGRLLQGFGGGLLDGELTNMQPQILQIPYWEDGLLLLASDGAWGCLKPNIISQVYSAKPDPKEFLLILTAFILESPADDNLTMIALGSPKS